MASVKPLIDCEVGSSGYIRTVSINLIIITKHDHDGEPSPANYYYEVSFPEKKIIEKLRKHAARKTRSFIVQLLLQLQQDLR